MVVAKKGGAKAGTKKKELTFWDQHKHLFPKRTRDFGVGGDLRKVKNLSRYVKWPRYIRLQRQRAVLKQRIKTPPAVNHFQTKALNVHQANVLLEMLNSYKPESKQEKKERIRSRAEALNSGVEVAAAEKPMILKFGLNHVTRLIESKKAKLVVIAHDVDPIELIVWMPALCRAMNVPYVIVKGKATLGRLVHQKVASCVALTDVRKEDSKTLEQFITNFRPQFNDAKESDLRKWGTHKLGAKANAREEKDRRKRARELRALDM